MQRVSAMVAIAAFEADTMGKAYTTPADARAGVAAMIQRGGVYTRFNDVFAALLPKSVVGIQDHLRSILEKDAPIELKKLMPGVTQPTPWPEDSLAQDRYGNAVRVMTIGWVCPFGMSMATPVETDNLALSAAAFKKHVCGWIGDVRDGFVGQSDLDSLEYDMIVETDTVVVGCEPL
jgi:hypothetical protein